MLFFSKDELIWFHGSFQHVTFYNMRPTELKEPLDVTQPGEKFIQYIDSIQAINKLATSSGWLYVIKRSVRKYCIYIRIRHK